MKKKERPKYFTTFFAGKTQLFSLEAGSFIMKLDKSLFNEKSSRKMVGLAWYSILGWGPFGFLWNFDSFCLLSSSGLASFSAKLCLNLKGLLPVVHWYLFSTALQVYRSPSGIFLQNFLIKFMWFIYRKTSHD